MMFWGERINLIILSVLGVLFLWKYGVILYLKLFARLYTLI
jgi:hypothetical protein